MGAPGPVDSVYAARGVRVRALPGSRHRGDDPQRPARRRGVLLGRSRGHRVLDRSGRGADLRGDDPAAGEPALPERRRASASRSRRPPPVHGRGQLAVAQEELGVFREGDVMVSEGAVLVPGSGGDPEARAQTQPWFGPDAVGRDVSLWVRPLIHRPTDSPTRYSEVVRDSNDPRTADLRPNPFHSPRQRLVSCAPLQPRAHRTVVRTSKQFHRAAHRA